MLVIAQFYPFRDLDAIKMPVVDNIVITMIMRWYAHEGVDLLSILLGGCRYGMESMVCISCICIVMLSCRGSMVRVWCRVPFEIVAMLCAPLPCNRLVVSEVRLLCDSPWVTISIIVSLRVMYSL